MRIVDCIWFRRKSDVLLNLSPFWVDLFSMLDCSSLFPFPGCTPVCSSIPPYAFLVSDLLFQINSINVN